MVPSNEIIEECTMATVFQSTEYRARETFNHALSGKFLCHILYNPSGYSFS